MYIYFEKSSIFKQKKSAFLPDIFVRSVRQVSTNDAQNRKYIERREKKQDVYIWFGFLFLTHHLMEKCETKNSNNNQTTNILFGYFYLKSSASQCIDALCAPLIPQSNFMCIFFRYTCRCYVLSITFYYPFDV